MTVSCKCSLWWWPVARVPLSLARRNLQANEGADCGGTQETLPGQTWEKKSWAGKKGTGKVVWGCKGANTKNRGVLSHSGGLRKQISFLTKFIPHTGRLSQTGTTRVHRWDWTVSLESSLPPQRIWTFPCGGLSSCRVFWMLVNRAQDTGRRRKEEGGKSLRNYQMS